MGHSQADKAQTRERILETAGRRFREKGVDGIGVADLMRDAGLTAGGFYKHFGSRDELVTEALGAAFGSWGREVARSRAEGKPLKIGTLLDEYLGEQHRDDPAEGCPFAALASDLTRCNVETRELASENLSKSFALLSSLLDEKDPESARERAILTYAALIGAVNLARMVPDPALSAEILQATRKGLARVVARPQAPARATDRPGSPSRAGHTRAGKP